MPKIALAGHRELTSETAGLVDDAVRDELSRTVQASHRAVVGVTCLAQGAEQLLARALADLGGELEVVIPACTFYDHLPEEARPEYHALLARSRAMHHLPAADPDERTFREAGYFMLVLADQLLAVWDGTNPRGADATAGVVAAAQARGLPVTVVWPTGARHA